MPDNRSTPPDLTLEQEETVLTARRARQLIRGGRSPLVPERLARTLRYRIPSIAEPEGPDVEDIFDDLARRVRTSLEKDGILPSEPEGSVSHVKLSGRERGQVVDFAALLCWLAEARALGRSTRTEREKGESSSPSDLVAEGLAWATLSNDPLQSSLCSFLCAVLQGPVGNTHEAERRYIDAIRMLESADRESADYHHIRLHLHYHYSRFLLRTGRQHEAAAQLEAIEADSPWLDDPPNRHLRVLIPMSRANIYWSLGNYAQALASARAALRWSDATENPHVHSALMQTLGNIYRAMEHPDEALTALLESVATLEAGGLAQTGAPVYNSVADAYHQLGEPERGLQMIERILTILGLDLRKRSDAPPWIEVNLRTTMADLLSTLGRHEESATILDWAIGKARELQFSTTVVAACAIAAKNARAQEDLDTAAEYLRSPLQEIGASSVGSRVRLYLDLARCEIDRGNDTEGERLLDTVEELIETNEIEGSRIRLLQFRSRLCERAGDAPGALEYEREAAELQRTLFEAQRRRSVSYARIIAETTMLEQAVETERGRVQEIEKRLAETAVQLGEREQLMKRIEEDLSGTLRISVDADPRALQRRVQRALSLLRERTPRSQSAVGFLDEETREFVSRLRTLYPHLTSRQERLAVLIRSGLTPDEICTLLEISREGLKSQRKRLRKSFQLAPEKKLEQMIAEI